MGTRDDLERMRDDPKTPANQLAAVHLLLDAIDGVMYADDSQVVMVLASKDWADSEHPAGVLVTVSTYSVQQDKSGKTRKFKRGDEPTVEQPLSAQQLGHDDRGKG